MVVFMFILAITALLILGGCYRFLLLDKYRRMVAMCVKLVYILLNVKIHTIRHGKKVFSYADVFEALVDAHPNRTQFITVDDGKETTLLDMEILANKLAHALLSLGLKAHDTIALMMVNRSEFVTFWIAGAKVGLTTALINTNSSGKTLLHAASTSLSSSSEKILIVDDELKANLSNDLTELSVAGIRVIFWEDLLKVVSSQQSKRTSKQLRSNIRENDPLLYIFTSGTTGLPKASKISHSRFIISTFPYSVICDLSPADRVYNVLPLYHSAGGMLGVGGVLRSGACMVLRKKFSARNFASDCVKYKCTSVQYIGELCRYLLVAPPSPDEERLTIRNACGNGLRPDVWEKFQARYRIQHIMEFYAATEGNLGLFNYCDKVGALGYVPRFADIIYPVVIVKTDPEDQEAAYRNEKGRCEVCKPNEVGLLVAAVDNSRVDRRFDGYTDSAATNKKILRDVFKKGDIYFNTGDLISRDELGFFFWSDRIGDTFRWKGENVSTAEVAHVLSSYSAFKDVTVYGVQVPGCDGRAGMAAVVLKEDVTITDVDWSAIASECALHLPSYARPLFIRISKKLLTTSTFKHIKGELVKEAFHLGLVGEDPIYFYSAKEKTFVPLSTTLYEDIKASKIQV